MNQKPKQKKSRAVKARRMWRDSCGTASQGIALYRLKSIAQGGGETAPTPMALLDISDPEALVEQVIDVLAAMDGWKGAFRAVSPAGAHYRSRARAVLTSLGILPAKKGTP